MLLTACNKLLLCSPQFQNKIIVIVCTIFLLLFQNTSNLFSFLPTLVWFLKKKPNLVTRAFLLEKIIKLAVRKTKWRYLRMHLENDTINSNILFRTHHIGASALFPIIAKHSYAWFYLYSAWISIGSNHFQCPTIWKDCF